VLAASLRYKTTVEKIMAVNPEIRDPTEIYTGDLLLIPPCSDKPTDYRSIKAARKKCKSVTYTVASGDYLYRVVSKINMNVGDLMKMNPKIRSGHDLKKGLKIKVMQCPDVAAADLVAPTGTTELARISKRVVGIPRLRIEIAGHP
jgi:LysM repeat protein